MTRIIQISDPHIVPNGQLAYGQVDTAAALASCVKTVNRLLPEIGPVDLAIVTGDPDITKKLKNKDQAQAMRQRQPVPVMAVRRYLRLFDEPFKFLTQLERALGITDANYRNLRRAIADYKNLDNKTQSRTSAKLLQMLRSKLSGTDITKKVQELVK